MCVHKTHIINSGVVFIVSLVINGQIIGQTLNRLAHVNGILFIDLHKAGRHDNYQSIFQYIRFLIEC